MTILLDASESITEVRILAKQPRVALLCSCRLVSKPQAAARSRLKVLFLSANLSGHFQIPCKSVVSVLFL